MNARSVVVKMFRWFGRRVRRGRSAESGCVVDRCRCDKITWGSVCVDQ
jgi:hypothetical protein